MNLFDVPEKSTEYIRVSLIRQAIIFFLLYGYLHVTQMWPGFESNVLMLAGLSIIYHYVVFFRKRIAERKAKQSNNGDE